MNIVKEPSTPLDIAATAGKYIAGGVVSLNRKVEPNIIFQHGRGSKIYDIDGTDHKIKSDHHPFYIPNIPFLHHSIDYLTASTTPLE